MLAIMQREHQTGFTLIELSIVLIIIGLVIGAILMGRDIIKSSEIRAQVSQFQKYMSAVNTFKLKYNALPGDMLSSQAQAFGFATRAGTAGQGDGNGLIEGGGPGSGLIAGECALFWNDLSTANLIDAKLVGYDCTAMSNACLASSASVPVSSIIPMSKLQHETNMLVWSGGDGFNYFSLYSLVPGAGGINVNGQINGYGPSYITPLDAYTIDTKIDDGFPLTGIMTIHSGVPYFNSVPAIVTPAASSPGVCVVNTTPATYNITGSANANTYSGCNMWVRIN